MTVERLDRCFARLKKENRAALIAYHMAHDPDYESSLAVMRELPKAGADILELGMPFSDPMAEGPTIQHAATRALKAGATLPKVLVMLREFRQGNKETPVVLMGYFNPVYHYGIKAFVKHAVAAGADGIIIVDLPYEEEEEFTSVALPAGLALIKLVAPTTGVKRARMMLKNASGFVYCISVAGVTGTKTPEMARVRKTLAKLKQITNVPVAIGFGIKTPEQVREAGGMADGVVVGSAIVKLIADNGNRGRKALLSSVSALVRALSAALR